MVPQIVFGQLDTNQLIGQSKEVVILKKVDQTDHPSININREEIDKIGGISLGDILRFTPGVQIKDYGGIGGLQSISVRSLGANHSGLIRNDVLMNGGSTGQINLSTIPSVSIEKIRFDIGNADDLLLPATAFRFANITTIQTNTYQRDTNKISLRTSLGYGSFATLEGNFGLKTSFNKGFVASNISLLNSEGNYSYTIPNSGSEAIYSRSNAAVFRYQFDFAAGMETKLGKTRIDYVRNYSNQELPGAVVLWLFNNEQYLKLGSDMLSIAHTYRKKRWALKFSSNYQYQQTHYTDSVVLNSQGFISDQYYFSRLQNNLSTHYFFKNNYSIYGGFSYNRSWLQSARLTIDEPTRNEYVGVIGFKKLFSVIPIKIESNLLFQHIVDDRDSNEIKRTTRFNPYISFSISPIKGKQFRLRTFYKFSNRLPSFNELYYNQIGNLDLKPEDAHQINFGVSYQMSPTKWMKEFVIRADVYHNMVKNKIVSIPTKDLFIWSIQNVEKAAITGVDVQFATKFQLVKELFLSLKGSYSYQQALNKTDAEHVTYNHQIAYIPEHQFNTQLGIHVYGAFLQWNSYYNGTRYHLNENTTYNQMNDFWINDLIVGYSRRFSSHQLRILFSINNLFNQRYEAIKSFPMLGRNFKLKLVYGFN